MSISDSEDSALDPDGGLLSVLGDVLFAGAILMLVYPCMHQTVNRLDRDFFMQLLYIVKIILAVAALVFLLMLVIAQQMRVAYCAVVRPFLGEEDKLYAGVMLKILVVFLLIFNYFCASGLQRVITSVSEWYSRPRTHIVVRGRTCFSNSGISPEAMNNNNATMRTHSTTTSTTFPSDSYPVFSSKIPVHQHHHHHHLSRDVGTMVRFSDYGNTTRNLRFPLTNTARNKNGEFLQGPCGSVVQSRPKENEDLGTLFAVEAPGRSEVCTTIELPNQKYTLHVQRRRVQPPRLPKVTRSGKRYG